MGCRVRFLSLLAAVLAASAADARSATLVVPDGYATIQLAIDAAVSGDSILVRAGTYSGPFTLAGKDVVLHGAGAYGGTILTGNHATRVLEIGAGVTDHTEIGDLEIRHGFATHGGGVLLAGGAAPRFTRCVFLQNRVHVSVQSSYGGAVEVGAGCSAEFADCHFFGNYASIDVFSGDFGFGGAIAARSLARFAVRGCTFEDNLSAGFEGGVGGAIYSDPDASGAIDECRFARNSAGVGGAIYGGPTHVRSSVFHDNQAFYGPSAIALQGPFAAEGAGPGLEITGNLLYANQLLGGAGTMDVRAAALIRNNTITSNQSPGGFALVASGGNRIENNIVAFNEGTGIFCLGASDFSVACNDVHANSANGSPANYGGSCGDLTGVDGNLSDDPLFCDPAARRFELAAGSPCAAGPCGLIGARPPGCANSGVDPAAGAALAIALPRPHPIVFPARISFTLPRPSNIALTVFDVSGRKIADLISGALPAGRREIEWAPAAGVPPGVYVRALTAGSERTTRRVVVSR